MSATGIPVVMPHQKISNPLTSHFKEQVTIVNEKTERAAREKRNEREIESKKHTKGK